MVSFSYIASIIVIFTPGGLGTREGILYLALKPLALTHVALIFAFASRIWLLLIEVALALIAIPILLLKRDTYSNQDAIKK
jgi:uncharacterized membrane protein YbhN (UPF0104 family)